jgi:hypothetical protein
MARMEDENGEIIFTTLTSVQILKKELGYWTNGSYSHEREKRKIKIEKIKIELRKMRKKVYNHKRIPVHNVMKLIGILSTLESNFRWPSYRYNEVK